MEPKVKSYKREVAVILLVWFMYLVETKEANLIEILVWPVFTYSAIAFGLDWFGKSTPFSGGPSGPSGMQWPPQAPDRRRPQRSGQYAGGEGEHSDDRQLDQTDLRDK